ncbi:MAG: lysylphosphatidylglycerol synthase transmembrane domain-containing protein [Bacteroidetes bacterium]|nr:lysylphosphatidylglycerol synthase transmembrane domain-containing protein [Bacteroidota bacterium]
MKKKLFSALQFIILLAVGITLLWLVFRHEDPKKIWAEIISADYRWVGLSLVISLAAYLVRAIRWKMLIDPLGYNPKLSNTFYSMMVGYLANLALPRLGEISRCGALSRSEKIPFEKLIGTVIVERVIDVICLLSCILLAAIVEFSRIAFFLEKYVRDPLKNKLDAWLHSAPLLIVLIMLVAVAFIFRKKILRFGFFTKLNNLLKGLLEGLRSVRKMKNNFLYFVLTVVMWSLYMISGYVCFLSLKATEHLDLKAGLFTLVAGGFGMSAPVQGGIGAFHFMVKEVLTMFDIPESDGLVYATVVHSSQTIFAIVLGFLSLLLLYFSRKKANHEST